MSVNVEKAFDALAIPEKKSSRQSDKQDIKNTLNSAFKGLVTIKDNRYVIQRG